MKAELGAAMIAGAAEKSRRWAIDLPEWTLFLPKWTAGAVDSPLYGVLRYAQKYAGRRAAVKMRTRFWSALVTALAEAACRANHADIPAAAFSEQGPGTCRRGALSRRQVAGFLGGIYWQGGGGEFLSMNKRG
ncbi:MAG: hypothetical protein K2L38_11975, partial [Dysosmobacter sp.]|nr:hypothetical protein [Dysosmobacter sp.]